MGSCISHPHIIESKTVTSQNDVYDCIVIGSGIGGLTCACMVAKRNKKVLVLEQNENIGGCIGHFQRKSTIDPSRFYDCDIGMHYVCKMEDKYGVITKLKDVYPDVKFEKMNEIYDRIVIFRPEKGKTEKQVYGVVSPFSEFVRLIIDQYQSGISVEEDKSKFENQKHCLYKGLCDFFEASQKYLGKEKKENVTLMNFVKTMKIEDEYPKFKFKPETKIFPLVSVAAFLETVLHGHDDLITVLSYPLFLIGADPKKMSAIMYPFILEYVVADGAFFPIGGPEKIMYGICDEIKKHGAEGTKILNSHLVKEILCEEVSGKKHKFLANGVLVYDKITKETKKFYAKSIVSNAGFLNTFDGLLPRRVSLMAGYYEKMKESEKEYSYPFFFMWLGIPKSDTELKMENANYYFYNSNKYSEDYQLFWAQEGKPSKKVPIPLMVMYTPSCRDPEWEKKYPKRTIIELLVPFRYEWVEKWNGTETEKRPQEYYDLKNKFAKRCLELLKRYNPRLVENEDGSKAYDMIETGTPLTTKHYLNRRYGECLGITKRTPFFLSSWMPSGETKIYNFYVTGSDCSTAGTMIAMSHGHAIGNKIVEGLGKM